MKWTISKLFDSAKANATDAGASLSDMISYLAEFCELTGRSVRSGLTFRDNFDCEERLVQLLHNQEQVVSLVQTKPITGVLLSKAVPETGGLMAVVQGFGWKLNDKGELLVKAQFDGIVGVSINSTIVVYY